jgi:hypothetical protein
MPPNASESSCYMFRQGRDSCAIRVVPHARKHSVFIGTNARSVVAPTGFEPVFTVRHALSLTRQLLTDWTVTTANPGSKRGDIFSPGRVGPPAPLG